MSHKREARKEEVMAEGSGRGGVGWKSEIEMDTMLGDLRYVKIKNIWRF